MPRVLRTQTWSSRAIHPPQQSCFHAWSVHPFSLECTPALQIEIKTAFNRGKRMGAITPLNTGTTIPHIHLKMSTKGLQRIHPCTEQKPSFFCCYGQSLNTRRSRSFSPLLVVQLKKFYKPSLFSLVVSDFHPLKMGICGATRNSSIFLGKEPEKNQSGPRLGAAPSRGLCVSSVRIPNYLGT